MPCGAPRHLPSSNSIEERTISPTIGWGQEKSRHRQTVRSCWTCHGAHLWKLWSFPTRKWSPRPGHGRLLHSKMEGSLAGLDPMLPNQIWSMVKWQSQEYCGPCKLMHSHYEKLPSVFKKIRYGFHVDEILLDLKGCGMMISQFKTVLKKIRTVWLWRIPRDSHTPSHPITTDLQAVQRR